MVNMKGGEDKEAHGEEKIPQMVASLTLGPSTKEERGAALFQPHLLTPPGSQLVLG